MENLNHNILARMKELGLKRKQVADQLNIDPSYFYRMIDGKQRWQLEYVQRIAELLKIPVWRLFYGGTDGLETEAPNLLLGPADREFMAARSEEYAQLPVTKLQVVVAPPDAEPPGHAACIIFIKKTLLEGFSMNKKPIAVELGVTVQ